MVYNTGDIVFFINGWGEQELGIVVIQYDNYDTEVMFADGSVLYALRPSSELHPKKASEPNTKKMRTIFHLKYYVEKP